MCISESDRKATGCASPLDSDPLLPICPTLRIRSPSYLSTPATTRPFFQNGDTPFKPLSSLNLPFLPIRSLFPCCPFLKPLKHISHPTAQRSFSYGRCSYMPSHPSSLVRVVHDQQRRPFSGRRVMHSGLYTGTCGVAAPLHLISFAFGDRDGCRVMACDSSFMGRRGEMCASMMCGDVGHTAREGVKEVGGRRGQSY